MSNNPKNLNMISQKFDKLNILVGLDLSVMDEKLIAYATHLNSVLKPAKIVFLHNLKINELPKHLVTEEKMLKIIKGISSKIIEQIGAHNPTYEFEIKIEVEPYTELAFKSKFKKQHFDLLLLGNKQQLEGSGGLNHKLMRLLPCSTLLIPETANLPLKNIISAIDFSSHSKFILDWGTQLKSKNGVKMETIYVSKFNKLFYTSLSENEIQSALLNDHLKRKKEWETNYAEISNLIIKDAGDKSVETVLLNFAALKSAELVIIGKQGASSIVDLFIGKVANSLMNRPTDVAILYVKKN